MKFSENGLYIEDYIKCATCGVLIYENRDQKPLTINNVTYCSQWCIEWKNARDSRRAASRQEDQFKDGHAKEDKD